MDQDAYDFPTLDRLIAGVDKNDIDPFKERLRYVCFYLNIHVMRLYVLTTFWQSRTRFLVLPAPIRDRKAVTSNITYAAFSEEFHYANWVWLKGWTFA